MTQDDKNTDKTPAPCGSWASPLSAEAISGATLGLGSVWIDGDAVYWTELRPWDKGRSVLVRWSDRDGTADISAPDHNVRTRVHEYGGRAFVAHGGSAWYVDAMDRTLYRTDGPDKVTPVVPKSALDFADLIADPARSRLIAVAERPRDGQEPENLIVAIGFDGTIQEMATGADFYACSTLSPDGSKLAWVEWMHPNMPWDATDCREAILDEAGAVTETRTVAGGPGISIFQPFG